MSEERRKRKTSQAKAYETSEGDDRFEVRGEIARGGMGRVLKAHDKQLGRTVAIKEMLASSLAHERRFEREVEITARLQHPSILPLYDSRRWHGGAPYYVMRLVSGRPLSELIKKTKDASERLALVPNLLAVADAMAFAHGESIIHRDIKPANILIGAHGETVLIDWGIAKILGETGLDDEPLGYDAPITEGETIPGSILGTLGYMPPEQAIGEVVERSADVYALGSTLYHLLTGVPAYRPTGHNGDEDVDGNRTPNRIVAKQLAGPPEPITKRAPQTPTDLAAIVAKAMASKPSDRYQDAAELASDLRRFTTGRLVAAHQYSFVQRARRFFKRHRAATVVGLAATAALAVVLVTSVNRIRVERNQAIAATIEAQTRADELLVSRAGALALRDPTTAAALLKRLPLGSSAHAAARDVFREARMRGIAQRVPGGGRRGMHWLPNGEVLVAASSSEVWMHDFRGEKVVSRRVHTDSEKNTVIEVVRNGRFVAIGNGTETIELRALEGSETTSFTLADKLDRFEAPVDGRFLAWRLKNGAIGFTDMATLESTTLEETIAFGSMTVSTDGRLMAWSDMDAKTIVYLDGTRIDVPPSRISPAFDVKKERLALASLDGHEIRVYQVQDGALVEHGSWRLDHPAVKLIYDGSNALVVQTILGEVFRLFRDRRALIGQTDSMPMIVASSNGVAVGSHESVVLLGMSRRTIVYPGSSEGAALVATSEKWISVANTSEEVHVWNLKQILPRRIELKGVRGLTLTTPDRGYATTADGSLLSVDLKMGTKTKLSALPVLASVIVNEATQVAALQYFDRFQLMHINGGVPKPDVPFKADTLMLGKDADAIYAVGDKVYRARPFESETPDHLATLSGNVTSFTRGAEDVFTTTDDGSMYKGLGPDKIRISLSSTPTTDPSGDSTGVVFAIDKTIYHWDGTAEADEKTSAVFEVARRPKSVYRDESGALVAIAEGAIYRFANGRVETAALPKLANGPMIDTDEKLGIGLTENRRPAFISILRGHTWLIGQYLQGVRVIAGAPQAPVFAVVVRGQAIDVYDLRAPSTPQELRAALERSTGAVVSEDLRSLSWPGFE